MNGKMAIIVCKAVETSQMSHELCSLKTFRQPVTYLPALPLQMDITQKPTDWLMLHVEWRGTCWISWSLIMSERIDRGSIFMGEISWLVLLLNCKKPYCESIDSYSQKRIMNYPDEIQFWIVTLTTLHVSSKRMN